MKFTVQQHYRFSALLTRNRMEIEWFLLSDDNVMQVHGYCVQQMVIAEIKLQFHLKFKY